MSSAWHKMAYLEISSMVEWSKSFMPETSFNIDLDVASLVLGLTSTFGAGDSANCASSTFALVSVGWTVLVLDGPRPPPKR